MIFSAHMQSTKLILFLAIVSDNSNFILCDFYTHIYSLSYNQFNHVVKDILCSRMSSGVLIKYSITILSTLKGDLFRGLGYPSLKQLGAIS